MMIDTVINGFMHNEASSHLHIYDNPIITFVKNVFYLGSSNTYHVGSLDIFRKVVVEKIKIDIYN